MPTDGKDLAPLPSLSLSEFTALADVPPELEWLANITNPKTWPFHKRDVEECWRFTGVRAPMELRTSSLGASPWKNAA